MAKVIIVLVIVVWVAAAIAFFLGPARAADRHADDLAASITRRDDVVLFRQLYRNKQPRSTLIAWVLTYFLTPTVSYIYSRQWVRSLLAFVTLQGFGIWWLVSIFSMPFEVMNINKRLADEAYAELRLARPEMYSGGGSLREPTPQGLNPQALRQAGYMPNSQVPAAPSTTPAVPVGSATGGRSAGASDASGGRPAAGAGDARSGAVGRYCSSCGAARPASGKFCPSCGASSV